MRTAITVAVAAALAGCAKPAVDTTPENPTAVFETRTSFSGIQGYFPFETTDKRFVRSDMRREQRDTKGTGTYSGWLVTRMAGGPGDTHIARLDRKVLWTVSEKNKQYMECPIAGCPMPEGMEKMQKPEAQKPEQPKQKTEEGCTTRITANNFNVKPSGQKKEVNGFNAEQYEGAWVVRMEDRQKRATTSTLKLDIWTTSVNGEMRKAMDTEEAFGRAYMAAVPKPMFPMSAKPGEAPTMPPEVMSSMSAYLGSLTAADRANFMRFSKELEKIKGHPVFTKMEWFIDGNACGSDKQEQEKQTQQSSPTSVSGALMSGAMSLFNKKEEKPAGPQPLMSFTTEVKQMGVVPVRDSVFLVPAGYKKAN
jgi:type IV pilus biogenesis protein CpaD/CtpE